MEHAIRKHCKVHLDEDPVLYEKVSEKLEAAILRYKENWDALCQELFVLREEALAGRMEDDNGVSKKAAPFYDLIGQIAFGKEGVPSEQREQVKVLVDEMLGKMKHSIGIINFWERPTEVSRLRGDLSNLMVVSGIDVIADKSGKIVAEITQLAKVRQKDILE